MAGNLSKTVAVEELARHCAYEVQLLVQAAVKFRLFPGERKMFAQDSAFLHARNLLEFTSPPNKKGAGPTNGWWIVEFGAPHPAADDLHESWVRFINSKVTHLGERRIVNPPPPIPQNDQRMVTLAKYVVVRMRECAGLVENPHLQMIISLANAGCKYLDNPTSEHLAPIIALNQGRVS